MSVAIVSLLYDSLWQTEKVLWTLFLHFISPVNVTWEQIKSKVSKHLSLEDVCWKRFLSLSADCWRSDCNRVDSECSGSWVLFTILTYAHSWLLSCDMEIVPLCCLRIFSSSLTAPQKEEASGEAKPQGGEAMRHVGIMKSTQGLYLTHQQKGKFMTIQLNSMVYSFCVHAHRRLCMKFFFSPCRSGCFHLPIFCTCI